MIFFFNSFFQKKEEKSEKYGKLLCLERYAISGEFKS
jgi:hypothetical protein